MSNLTSGWMKDVPKDRASEIQLGLREGMFLKLHGELVQLGFGTNPLAPVISPDSFRSLPVSFAPTASLAASQASIQLPAPRVRSRSLSPERKDAGSGKRALVSLPDGEHLFKRPRRGSLGSEKVVEMPIWDPRKDSGKPIAGGSSAVVKQETH